MEHTQTSMTRTFVAVNCQVYRQIYESDCDSVTKIFIWTQRKLFDWYFYVMSHTSIDTEMFYAP